MDRGPVVTSSAGVSAGHVQRAIFTSMRSPMGEGYRIVAASPGISREEKREIVQSAPSHQSLCDPSHNASGLASFILGSGRRCIFLSRAAGVEHTGRGGQRVLTQVLVIEPELFRRFHCDVLRVEAAVRPALSDHLPEAQSTRLEPLALSDRVDRSRTSQDRARLAPPQDQVGRTTRVLSALLEQQRTLIVGMPAPRDVLRWALAATPVALRQHLSLSCGLKYSPARRFQFILADASPSEVERIARDHEVEVIRWESAATAPSSPYQAWLRFVQHCWAAGRAAELERLSAEATEDGSAGLLEQIASLYDDLARVPTADAPLLHELSQRHANQTPLADPHGRLLNEFRHVVAARRAALEQAEQESDESSAEAPAGQA